MALIPVECPMCEKETRIMLINIELGSHEKTYTCENCSKRIVLKYQMKPAPEHGLHRDRKWLRKKYVEEDNTMQQVAEMCGVSAMTVRDWLKRHQIQIRSRGNRR